MINNALVVTRHAALVEYLVKNEVVNPENMLVIEHASVEQIQGRDVIGILPMHLASECASLTIADLAIPPELRGKELSLEDISKYVTTITTYVVTVKTVQKIV